MLYDKNVTEQTLGMAVLRDAVKKSVPQALPGFEHRRSGSSRIGVLETFIGPCGTEVSIRMSYTPAQTVEKARTEHDRIATRIKNTQDHALCLGAAYMHMPIYDNIGEARAANKPGLVRAGQNTFRSFTPELLSSEVMEMEFPESQQEAVNVLSAAYDRAVSK